MRGRRLSLLLAGCLVLLAVGAESAAACSCAWTPAETFARADAAVTARLIEVRPVASAPETEADYRYRVGKVYKGPGALRRGRVIRIRNYTGTSCAMLADVGRVRGLFLWREDGRWTSNACGETTPKRLRRAARAGAGAGGSSAQDCRR